MRKTGHSDRYLRKFHQQNCSLYLQIYNYDIFLHRIGSKVSNDCTNFKANLFNRKLETGRNFEDAFAKFVAIYIYLLPNFVDWKVITEINFKGRIVSLNNVIVIYRKRPQSDAINCY